ncbi:MAG: protein kinase [Planctomycetota bacterium]
MSAPPREVGPYRLVRRLGGGGMGEVWEATHTVSALRHALKLVRAPDPEVALRFEREAEALARLEHPRIVRVHAVGREGDTLWLAQDLVAGESLDRRLERGPLAVDEALRLTRELGGALSHAHARGLLHRDLKPHNVLLNERGAPVLVDFGLALMVGRERLTQTGSVLGTPGYMAPEQCEGAPQDERADVYGLAATLYAMLVGRAPHVGASPLAVLDAVLHAPIDRPRALRPEVPAPVERALLWALERDPQARPPSVTALVEALAGGARSRPRPRRLLAPLGAALLLAVALALRASLPTPAPPPPSPAQASPAVEPARRRPPDAEAPYRAALLAGDAVALERAALRGPPGDPALRAAVSAFWRAAAARRLARADGDSLVNRLGAGLPAAELELRQVLHALRLARQADPRTNLIGDPALQGLFEAAQLTHTPHLRDLLESELPDEPVSLYLRAAAGRTAEDVHLLQRALRWLDEVDQDAAVALLRSEVLNRLRWTLVQLKRDEEVPPIVEAEAARPNASPKARMLHAELLAVQVRLAEALAELDAAEADLKAMSLGGRAHRGGLALKRDAMLRDIGQLRGELPAVAERERR